MITDQISRLQLLLGLMGALVWAVSLHYRKAGEPIQYGGWGFAQNLTTKGKCMALTGILLILISLMWGW